MLNVEFERIIHGKGLHVSSNLMEPKYVFKTFSEMSSRETKTNGRETTRYNDVTIVELNGRL